MIIIGIIGPMASGKSTATEYIAKEYQAKTYRFSDIMRDVLQRLYLPCSRDNLIQISIVLREEFGHDLFAKAMAEDIKQDDHNEYIVVEGIRREEDISFLKLLPNFHLVGITGDIERRYQRLTSRTENSDDQHKTYEDFVADHERETEKSIVPLTEKTEYLIHNNGTIEDLYTEIKNTVEKLKIK
jgi:dephospho-CoA kinase